MKKLLCGLALLGTLLTAPAAFAYSDCRDTTTGCTVEQLIAICGSAATSAEDRMSACRQAISMLQARLQSSVSQSMACVDLTYDLWIRKTDGETGGEDSKLQRFLVCAGVYPEATITSY